LLKLVIEARGAELIQVDFPAEIGPSFVYASNAAVQSSVDQFLGLNGRALPANEPKRARPARPAKAKAKRRKRLKLESLESISLQPTGYGRTLVKGLFNRVPSATLPLYYPTLIPGGSDFAQKPRGYEMKHIGPDAPPRGQRAAYRWVLTYPGLNQYWGFQGTGWKNPPILNNPTEERTFGKREYQLFYDGGRLRLVAWQNDEGSFWVANTLTKSMPARMMIEIARDMREYRRPGT